jgi:site-specific DNA-methyltransferase (adenine-specific)
VMNATGPGWELRLADCMSPDGLPSLADGSVDHVITDPPFSERTHEGQRTGRRDAGHKDGWVTTAGLSYDHLEPAGAAAISAQLSRVRSSWCLVFTSHDLFRHWEDSLGGYTFAPVPVVLEGANVRLAGDGPSSWTTWLLVNRAVGLVDGTKPGAYIGKPERGDNPVKGHKPLWLMERLLRDYTKPGDLVCDPYAGSGTTGIACIKMGRRFIGWEQKPEHFAYAERRMRAAREQLELLP